MTISVIIPTYNGLILIKRNLPYLIKSLETIDNEIIVIDNGSVDGTDGYIKDYYPNIIYKKLNKNYGFTRAINEGVKIAKGIYILILNNDCFLEKNTVTNLFKTIKDSDFIATQPIVYTKNKKKIENIGYVVDTWVGKAKPVTNIKFSIYSLETRYIYGLSATCLLIQKDVFKKIGMFDESLHSYLEDVDLFIRLQKAGYNYGPSLSAGCIHYHMATSSKMGVYKEKRDFLNWIRIIFKNFDHKFIIGHIQSLFVERLRNFSGMVKKMLQ